MAEARRPIGVFDSGVGGLSVLKALVAELPHEDFVYVADSGYAPYGERTADFVAERAGLITRHLCLPEAGPIKALVIACNTATAAAIHLLRQEHPALPIIGVEPALKPAVASSQTGRIGVMATRGTLSSQKFQTLMETLAGQAAFVCQPCDGLADAIERGDDLQIKALIAQYTRAMGRFGEQANHIDTLVLGCTHYPFASETLQALLPAGVKLIDNGEPVARQTRRMLSQLAPAGQPGQISLWATGAPTRLEDAARRWMTSSAPVQALRLVSAAASYPG